MSSKFVAPAPLSPLSAREREALVLAGQGCTYDEIAAEMGTRWHTVKNQLDAARKKLHCKRTDLAFVALMRLERKGTK